VALAVRVVHRGDSDDEQAEIAACNTARMYNFVARLSTITIVKTR
jgi:hypothetical protein